MNPQIATHFNEPRRQMGFCVLALVQRARHPVRRCGVLGRLGVKTVAGVSDAPGVAYPRLALRLGGRQDSKWGLHGVDRIIIEFTAGGRCGQTEVYPVARFSSLYIGRDAQCDIRVDAERDVMVSRSHAVIEWADDEDGQRRYTLTDLLSSNGTWLNGERVFGTVDFADGDRLRLGKSGPEFVIRIERPPVDLQSQITQSMPEMGVTPAPFLAVRIVDSTQPASVTRQVRRSDRFDQLANVDGEVSVAAPDTTTRIKDSAGRG